MTLNLALNLWGIRPSRGRTPQALRTDLQQVASWGYQAIEATCGPQDRLRFGDDPAAAEALRQAAEDCGLQIPSLCSGATWEAKLNAKDPAQRARAQAAIIELIEIAARLGDGLTVLLTPGTTTMPGQPWSGVTTAQAWDLALEALTPLAKRAADAGVSLALENSWTRFLSTPKEAAQFLSDLACPAVGWYLDLGNAGLYADPCDWIQTLGEGILMVQAKDFLPTAEGGKLSHPGDGTLDWDAALAALEEVGYQRPLVVEAAPDGSAARKAANFLHHFERIRPAAVPPSTAGPASAAAPAPTASPSASASPPASPKLRVAIVGLGGMGRLHAGHLLLHPGVQLTAVVDPTRRYVLGPRPTIRGIRRMRRILGLSLELYPSAQVRRCTSIEELLAGDLPDAVWLCTPTDLHPEQAVRLLAAGCNVFCEKPMALTPEAAADMVQAADAHDRRLAIGQCIRFWPEWRLLQDRIRDGRFGSLQSLDIWRLSGRPAHAVAGWLDDPQRSGGAALDLHVHDTDFLLGLPFPATLLGATVEGDQAGAPQTVHSSYRLDQEEPCLIRCHSGWRLPPGYPFRSGLRAGFQRGTLSFGEDGLGLTYYPEAGGREALASTGDAFADQLQAVVELFRGGKRHPLLDLDRAQEAVAMVHAELELAVRT